MHKTHWRKIVVHLLRRSSMNGAVVKFNKIFFSNTCWWFTSSNFCFLILNRTLYSKQYSILCLCATHFFIFVKYVNWSIEGNFTIYSTHDYVLTCHSFAISSLMNSSPQIFVAAVLNVSRNKRYDKLWSLQTLCRILISLKIISKDDEFTLFTLFHIHISSFKEDQHCSYNLNILQNFSL